MNKIEEIKKRTAELLNYAHAYYDLDAPLISDAQYDKLYNELETLENEAGFWLSNSPTRKVQGETLPYLTKVKHSVPMLSADKSTDIEDVKKFIGNHNIVMSYKLDGATVVLKYQDGQFIQALSRGSGIEGEDITHTAKMIKNLPMTIPYKGYLEVRGEALIPWKYYNEMNVNGDMGHPRNVASGGLRQLSADEAAKRNIYFYAFTLVNWKEVLPTIDWGDHEVIWTKLTTFSFLNMNGFDVVPYSAAGGYNEDPEMNQAALNVMFSKLNRETYENPTDGWCFEYDDLWYGDSLGSTEHHDRRLFALKPEIEEYTTIFRGVDYNTCRTGVVSLTAMFDPVEIANTTVSRATLHNVDIFNNLKLGEGDKISVAKFNEIIPGIVDNLTRSGTYQLIDKCPSCGSTLIIKNTGTANFLYCPNDECPAKQLAKFTHFVSRKCANIENLSEKTLELLISHGFLHSFKDIYHLDVHKEQLMCLEGLGEKSVNTLLKSIEKSRDIKLENFINALGIPGVGLSAAKLMSDRFNGDFDVMVKKITQGFDFTTIEGFGETTNASIQRFFYDMLTVCDLAEEMHFVVEEKKTLSSVSFEGLSFCITGGLAHFANRDALVADIEAHGGKFVSSVSAKCNYLINNDSTSASSKNKKAQSLSIPIITEEEYLKLRGE